MRLNKIEKEQLKSGNIISRNTEKDFIVDLNVHFPPIFSNSNFSYSKIAQLSTSLIGSVHCGYLMTHNNKFSFCKLRVAYNDL